MGVYLYSPQGGREFFKDPAKSNEMIAAGYTFAPVEKVDEEDKPLTKPQVIAELTELEVEFDKNEKVAVLRETLAIVLADIASDTDQDKDE